MANQARGDACRSRLAEKLSAQTVAVQADGDPLAGPVHDALASLGSRDREVLLLAEWEGLTPAEIARVMRCPAVSVRVRLHRARRRFRALFESQTEETNTAAPVLSLHASADTSRDGRVVLPGTPTEFRRSKAMPTDLSLEALRKASPRNQPGFDESI